MLRIPRFSAVNSLDPTAALNNGSGGGGGWVCFPSQPTAQPSAGAEEDVDAAAAELVALIRDTVEPDSWREYGGLGSIRVFHGLLIVRNTLAVHQQLGGYLAENIAGP